MFFVEAPKAVQHVFLFPFLISLGFKTSVSFLLESTNVCQSYFCFYFELVLGLAAAVNYGNCTEICQGPVKVDAAPSPHLRNCQWGVNTFSGLCVVAPWIYWMQKILAKLF
jgi:hypothetical protein